ncbi:quinone oxidoreductase family protein [Rhizobium halophytocola]|uniref:NADPH2:quinone reductase n=1 Tax=Rhizobium halophytocola TaxID=735519 RepID=A0ABS4DSN5_9HYPH|nr:quinone oxidoreductase [Rhizobium halophytocola]MBP1848629.1 NADPH2:quinone reductase [Rhizobium halophytocola]
MTRQVTVTAPGGADMLTMQEATLPDPAAGEVRIRQTMIGVNYVDVYHRTGLYPLPEAQIPGVEAVGVIEAVGPDVTGFAAGDRVIYAGAPAGAYAAARNMPATRVLALPDGIDDATGAGSFLRGLTAYMLLERVCRLAPGQSVLIQAAAGGLGLVLGQWARRRGLATIGTVSTAQKAEVARAHGFDHTILYREQDVAEATRDLTGGTGVDAVIDGIGGETFSRSLTCVKPFGTVVSVGTAGGALPPLSLDMLANKALTRPSILAAANDTGFYREAAAAWFAMLADGLTLTEGHSYPLGDAAKAHRDLEAGRTVGPVRLIT